MKLSVVLCTWNNSATLASTLYAISECYVPGNCDWEVVAVDNNSTDSTSSVVDQFNDRLPILYVEEPRQGLSIARNAGIRAASGELLLFTDDDVRPDRLWIETYLDAHQRFGDGFYFGGPLRSIFEGARPDGSLLRYAPWSVKGLDWGPDERLLAANEKFVSANWACPRKALERVGLFDEGLGLNAKGNRAKVGEESDLMIRLQEAGWQPVYLPDAVVGHLVPQEKASVYHIAERQEAFRWIQGVGNTYPDAMAFLSHVRHTMKLFRNYLSLWIRKKDWKEAYVVWRGERGFLRSRFRATYSHQRE